MAEPTAIATIYVVAGTNGAGKSSIAGAAMGPYYYNPDEATRKIRAANPGIALGEANGAAWEEGRRLLEAATQNRQNFAFETTLGGRTITDMLERATLAGMDVRIWYAGLSSPELHIARVRARVAKGGHDIPEQKIRERYNASRLNLIRLLPLVAGVRVFDNSAEADPHGGSAPQPILLLHMEGGRIVSSCDLAATPEWAKPIMLEALRASATPRTPARPPSGV